MSSFKYKIKEHIKSVLGFNKKVYSADKQYTLVVSDDMRFAGKIAIVTGGAGAIGKATCIRLVAEGATVYIAGRTEAKLDATIEDINQIVAERGHARKLVVDVCDYDSIHQAFQKVIEVEGKIDILINCAGGGARNKAKRLFEQDVEVIDDVLNGNLRGSILCAKEVAKPMMDNNYGKIVNLSSTIGMNGMERCVDYSAAKAGMLGLTKALAKELGAYGVNVNCVTPGSIQRGEYTLLEAERLKGTNYLNAIGTLEDIANAIVFLVSEESKFITGQNLIVDGGRILAMKNAD